ncbi:MAG: M56 family metallopeptidase [Lachnospiraceae bacterium]|nr:M56 family metallopeptidase [Lachnospiraceae bacterium]
MSSMFIKLLNLSINASWLILAVVVLRFVLKKSPKWIFCILWGLVALRLICPVSIESALSLLPSGKAVPETTDMQPGIDTGIAAINNTINPAIRAVYATSEEAGANVMQNVLSTAFCIWIAGMAAMILYAFISYITVRRKVRASIRFKENIMLCDELKTPFILGMIRPLIYVPSALEAERMEMVCAHEKAHISRHDHWWKPLGFVLLSVYWFNPLCWLAYILLCRDIEAACDEKVIKDKDRAYMAAYSQTLLDLSISGKLITACPLAFGETGVKSRIKGILNYKKPAFWIIIIAVIACVAVAVCFLTVPKKEEADLQAEVSNALDNMGIDYTYEDGVYVAKDRDGNKKSYRYKRKLSGRDPGAVHDGMFIVLTNDPDITYEKISRSLFSSNSNDWLKDSVITGMHVLDDNGNVMVFSEEAGDGSEGESSSAPADVQYRKPPALIISCAGKEYAATLGTYEWTYTDEEGNAVAVNADAAHPLDMVSRMAHVYADNDNNTISFGFETPPEKAVLKCWNMGSAGEGASYDEYESVSLYVTDRIAGGKCEITALLSGSVPIVAELYGEWEAGTASYYFAVMAEDTSGGTAERLPDIQLPEGYSLSAFSGDNGYMGGCYILPQAYTAEGADGAPAAWLYSGTLTRLPAGNVGLKYNGDHSPDENTAFAFDLDNHSVQDYIRSFPLENMPDGWYVMEFYARHDLYTQPERLSLEEQGITLTDEDCIGAYHVFWYVKDGSDLYYMISLAANCFTREQAEQIGDILNGQNVFCGDEQ